MGDHSNLHMTVRSADPAVLDAALDLFAGYGDEPVQFGQSRSHQEVRIGAWGLSVGTVFDLARDLDELMSEVGPFAYSVNDEPVLDDPGTLLVHLPGVGNHHGPCDAVGAPVVDASAIAQMVRTAHDLPTLQTAVADVLNVAVLDGFASYPDGPRAR